MISEQNNTPYLRFEPAESIRKLNEFSFKSTEPNSVSGYQVASEIKELKNFDYTVEEMRSRRKGIQPASSLSILPLYMKEIVHKPEPEEGNKVLELTKRYFENQQRDLQKKEAEKEIKRKKNEDRSDKDAKIRKLHDEDIDRILRKIKEEDFQRQRSSHEFEPWKYEPSQRPHSLLERNQQRPIYRSELPLPPTRTCCGCCPVHMCLECLSSCKYCRTTAMDHHICSYCKYSPKKITRPSTLYSPLYISPYSDPRCSLCYKRYGHY